MAAPRDFGEDIRETIHVLVNQEGVSAPKAITRLEEQYGRAPSLPRVREIAREEKASHQDPILEADKAGQLKTLLDGLVICTHAEITRIQGEKGEVDADQLLKLARTIREIEPLLSPKPSGNKDEEPKGLLGTLGKGRTQATEPTSEAGAQVRSLHAQAG